MSTIDIPADILDLSPYGPTRSTIQATPLSADDLRKTEIYWRTCNYLSLGDDLSAGESTPERASPSGANQESLAGALGLKSWTFVHLRSPEPADQEVRP